MYSASYSLVMIVIYRDCLRIKPCATALSTSENKKKISLMIEVTN